MASEIPLPIAPRRAGRADLTVIAGLPHRVPDAPPAGEVLCERKAGTERIYVATEVETGFLLRFPAACDIAIDVEGRTIECHRDHGLGEALVPILLVGTVAAFLLTLRGSTVLHGACIRHDHATLGIVGPSGAGKSTLAALFCATGDALVSDDVVALRPASAGNRGSEGNPPVVLGGWPELRLRADAGEIVEVFAEPPVVRTTADGRIAVQPRSARGPSDLGALLVPRPTAGDGAPSVGRLGPKEALFALLTSERVQGWCRADWQQRQFNGLADVAATVPTFAVDIPRGAAFRPDTAATVLDAIGSGRLA